MVALAECPVCGKVYQNVREGEMSRHVEECLTLAMVEGERLRTAPPAPKGGAYGEGLYCPYEGCDLVRLFLSFALIFFFFFLTNLAKVS